MPDQERSDKLVSKTLSFRLMLAHNAISKPFQTEFGSQHDLLIGDWRCVMALASWPNISGEQIARELLIDRMAASRSLRKLERQRRAKRTPDPANKRRNQWQLTASGWALFDIMLPDALERDKTMFANVSKAERKIFFDLLDRVIAAGP